MRNLRNQARGRDCQVRLDHICNFDSDTVVLAHFRMPGISGMGWKSPDPIGAHCCSACHAYVDSHNDDATQLAFALGVMRTLNLLISEGLIKW